MTKFSIIDDTEAKLPSKPYLEKKTTMKPNRKNCSISSNRLKQPGKPEKYFYSFAVPIS